MSLDQILKEMEARPGGPLRDPNNYAFSVFGTPVRTQAIWGWRFEGSSFDSMNVHDRRRSGPWPARCSSAPNPANCFGRGHAKVCECWQWRKIWVADLIKSLTPEPNKKLPSTTTRVTQRHHHHRILAKRIRVRRSVLPAGDMTPPQQKLLMTLVENYAYRLRQELADQDLAKRSRRRGSKKFISLGPAVFEPGLAVIIIACTGRLFWWSSITLRTTPTTSIPCGVMGRTILVKIC